MFSNRIFAELGRLAPATNISDANIGRRLIFLFHRLDTGCFDFVRGEISI